MRARSTASRASHSEQPSDRNGDKSIGGYEQGERIQYESQVRNGAALMALAGIAFVAYRIVFLVVNYPAHGGAGLVSELGLYRP